MDKNACFFPSSIRFPDGPIYSELTIAALYAQGRDQNCSTNDWIVDLVVSSFHILYDVGIVVVHVLDNMLVQVPCLCGMSIYHWNICMSSTCVMWGEYVQVQCLCVV